MGRPERVLLLCTFALCALGIVMVYSTTAIYAGERYGDALFFFRRELAFVLIGLTGLVMVRSAGVERLRRWSLPALLTVFALLGAVLVVGHEAGGAQRWFRIFKFSFQPIEIAKPFLVLYLADFLSRRQHEIKRFSRSYLPAGCVVGAVVLLVLMQPDLGSAFLLTVVSGALFFVAGIRPRYLGATLLAVVPAFIGLILAAPYRRRRLLAFFNPWEDPQGVGFQSIQSFLAVSSGGVWGVGLGESRQKLFFLPQAHTDFIYSIIAEEMGLWGAAGVLVLFGVFVWTGIRIALGAKNLFGSLLGIGVTLTIGLQALIHMAVSVGALPTKGLPLPFISYGGSALVFHLVCVGMVLALARERSWP